MRKFESLSGDYFRLFLIIFDAEILRIEREFENDRGF
jgi:hypothetical protein